MSGPGHPGVGARARRGRCRFFEGLELVGPGLVSCPLWHPESPALGTPDPVDAFGAVGRKP